MIFFPYDGSLWVLGVLRVHSVLNSTEIIDSVPEFLWKRSRGPDIPRALFEKCMERFSNGRIMLFGGFGIDGIRDKSMYYEWKGHFSSGLWETKPGTTLDTARHDHALFSTGDAILVEGGCKSAYNIKTRIDVYNGMKNRRMAPDLTLSNKAIDKELPDALHSVLLGMPQKNITFLGVVSCTIKDTILGLKTCYIAFHMPILDDRQQIFKYCHERHYN